MAAAPVIPPQEPAPPSEVARIAFTFFSPSKTFSDLQRSASWWAPYLLIVVVSLAFITVVDQKIGFPKVVENLIQLQPKQADRVERLPADQREKVMQQQATITKMISYAIPVIALLLYAVYAAVLLATLKFGADAQVEYKRLYALIVYSRLPELFSPLLAMVAILAGVSTDSFNLQNPVATNLGYFIAPDGSAVLRTLLSTLDVLTIWSLILTSIGIVYISKVKRSTAFAIVFGWFAFIVLARVALTAATS